MLYFFCFFFFQAEDGIRDLVRSRGLGDVYKRQRLEAAAVAFIYGEAGAEISAEQLIIESGAQGIEFLSLIHI